MSSWWYDTLANAASTVSSAVLATTTSNNTANNATNHNNNSNPSSNRHHQLSSMIDEAEDILLKEQYSQSNTNFFPLAFSPYLRKYVLRCRGVNVDDGFYDNIDDNDGATHHDENNSNNNNTSSTVYYPQGYTNNNSNNPSAANNNNNDNRGILSFVLTNHSIQHVVQLLDLLTPGGGESAKQYQEERSRQEWDDVDDTNNNNNSGGDINTPLNNNNSFSSSNNNNHHHRRGPKMNDLSTLKQRLREEFDEIDRLFEIQQKQSSSAAASHHRSTSSRKTPASIVEKLYKTASLAFLFEIHDFCDAFATVVKEKLIKVIHSSGADGSVRGAGGVTGAVIRANNTFASVNDLTAADDNNNNNHTQKPDGSSNTDYKKPNHHTPNLILYELIKAPGANTHKGISGCPPLVEMRQAVSQTRAQLFRAVYYREPTAQQERVSDEEWEDVYMALFPLSSTGTSVSQVYQSAADTLGSEKAAGNGNKGQPLARQIWEDDNKVTVCKQCGKEFQNFPSMIRRSHCRCCGSIYCKQCLDPARNQGKHLISRDDCAFPSDKEGPFQKACLDCWTKFGGDRHIRFLQDLIERCGFSIPETHILATIDKDWMTAATRVLRLYRESIYTNKPDPRHDRMVLETAKDANQHPQLLLRLARLESKTTKYTPSSTTSSSSNSAANNNTNNTNNNNQITFRKRTFIASQLWDMLHHEYDEYRAISVADQICAFMLQEHKKMIFSHHQLGCTRACYFSDEDHGTFAVMILAALNWIPSSYHQYTPVLINNKERINELESNSSSASFNNHNDDGTPSSSNDESRSPTAHQRRSSVSSSASSSSFGYYNNSSSSLSSSTSFINTNFPNRMEPITWYSPLKNLPLLTEESAKDIKNNGKILYQHSEIINEPVQKIRKTAMMALVGNDTLWYEQQPQAPLPGGGIMTGGTATNTSMSLTSRNLSSASPTPRASDFLPNNNNAGRRSSTALLAASSNNDTNNDNNTTDSPSSLLGNNNNNNNRRNNNNNYDISGSATTPLVRSTPRSRVSVWLYALTDMLTTKNMDPHSEMTIKTIIQHTIRGERGLMLKVFNEFRCRNAFVSKWNRETFVSVVENMSDPDLKLQFSHLKVFYEMLTDVAQKKPTTNEEARRTLVEVMSKDTSDDLSNNSPVNGTHRFAADNHHHHNEMVFGSGAFSRLQEERDAVLLQKGGSSSNQWEIVNVNDTISNKLAVIKHYRDFLHLRNPVLYPFDQHAATLIVAIDISNVNVLSSNSKPILIPLLCQNLHPAPGHEHKFTIKKILLKMEDLWRDHLAREFAFILFDLVTGNNSSGGNNNNTNNIYRKSSSFDNATNVELSFLKGYMYSVLPLDKDCGIVEILTDTVKPLEKILEETVKNERRDAALARSQQNNSNNTNNNTITQKPNSVSSSSSIAPVTRDSGLRQYLLRASTDPEDIRRQVFCRSVQFSILLCHILGVADRHLSNVMIDQESLVLVDIDFGHMFGSRTFTEQLDLLGKNLILYYGSPQAQDLTCARFDPLLSDAVAEMRFQTNQAYRERKNREHEEKEKQRKLEAEEKRKKMEEAGGGHHQSSDGNTNTASKAKVTITRIPSSESNAGTAAAAGQKNNTATNNSTSGNNVVADNRTEDQKVRDKLLKQREQALDEFIDETAKLLFHKVRPYMDVISLLLTRSSSYLQDLQPTTNAAKGSVGNNTNNNNSSSNATHHSNAIVGAGGSPNPNSTSSNTNSNRRRNNINKSTTTSNNDDIIASHFFNCFALTKKDNDAIDSFRRELKEQRSRMLQDWMHTIGQKGAVGLLSTGLDSVKDFFGNYYATTTTSSSSSPSSQQQQNLANDDNAK